MLTIIITSGILTVIMVSFFCYGLAELLYTINRKVSTKWKWGNKIYWLMVTILFNVALLIFLPLHFIVKKRATTNKWNNKSIFQKSIKKMIPSFIVYIVSVNIYTMYYNAYLDKKYYDSLPVYQKLEQGLNGIEILQEGNQEEISVFGDEEDTGLSAYPVDKVRGNDKEEEILGNDKDDIEVKITPIETEEGKKTTE